MTPKTVERDLAAEIRAGNVRGLARAITMVEQRDPSLRRVTESLADRMGHPLVVGLTGAPGTGKSTLADALVSLVRGAGESIAVLAVDPNSPYSGGAILGDRIRMQRHALDGQVYIRSMGARGHLGGLSVATREAIRLLAAFGFDNVILETVGVGQSELEVAAIAGTTVVVLTPGLGDGVQMIKAGIMEIADVFAVNKADLPGADRTVQEIRLMLNMGPKRGWRPPIVRTTAGTGEGVPALYEAVRAHRRHLESTGEAGERAEARLRDEAADLVGEWSRAEARRLLDEDAGLAAELHRERVPYGIAAEILTRRGARLVPEAARSES
ncbi:MAG: methylmalonyl Co-A mutase-associated GTPase MeaB [Candidatus Dormibacteraeota bacterium]|nr:methylmalonyl Co-A mutase-associated GTPase MeaB [Candidatus Dormibacteraeota bacterium]